jgi:hypothetical protein
MKTKPPVFGKPHSMTIAEKIEELSVIDDIDDMLREGLSCNDVAKFIQFGLEELTDVKSAVLKKELLRRRKEVLRVKPRPVYDERLAAIIPEKNRKPSVLSYKRYEKTTKAMDRLIELEALYLSQRDRLDYLVEKEMEHGYPFEMTGREFLVAAKFLELHGKEERAILEAAGIGLAHDKLDIKGYSEETSEVLQKPDSRRRVVSIVERLKRVKGGKEIPELPEALSEE